MYNKKIYNFQCLSFYLFIHFAEIESWLSGWRRLQSCVKFFSLKSSNKRRILLTERDVFSRAALIENSEQSYGDHKNNLYGQSQSSIRGHLSNQQPSLQANSPI